MTDTLDAESFWEQHHRARRGGGTGHPNPVLKETAGTLHPGAALDLGCGAGGDTIWLARQGWQVTAVDISSAAVERVRARSRQLGLDGRVTGEQHDLARSFPDGQFDLISAQYLHTPFVLDRARVLRTAADALRPGGHLLIVDHGSAAPWSWNKDPDTHYPAPGETAAELALDPARWSVVRAAPPGHRTARPDRHRHRQRPAHPPTRSEKLMPPTTRTGKRRDTGPAWTAPGEKDTLVGFIDYLRTAIMHKVADVPEPEVRTAGVPSGTNLLGLVKHLTAVERFYFLEVPITNMRRTFQPTRDETVDGLLADYRATIAQANQVVETWTDLTRPAPRPPGRGALPPSQRWVLVHMIEEIGRHAGHADIIREGIDGSTGR